MIVDIERQSHSMLIITSFFKSFVKVAVLCIKKEPWSYLPGSLNVVIALLSDHTMISRIAAHSLILARRNLSLIARPNPTPGTSSATIISTSISSNWRMWENKFCAASTKSPDSLNTNWLSSGIPANFFLKV